MNFPDISNIRLINQQIDSSRKKTVKELVQHMCAMQAQDYNMATWAIGVRLPGSTHSQVEAAFNNGEIIRTHLLRPTWHFVATDDADWILDLTAPHIKSLIKTRHNQLELTEAVIAKSNNVIRKILEDGRHLTRDEIKTALQKAGIQTDENRASHLLLCAELDKVICSGSVRNNKQSYVRFEKRVLKKNIFHREEAISQLAKRYFNSHGPATLQDFVWWSGLPVKDARSGLENIKSGLISETINEQIYWFPNPVLNPGTKQKSVHLLPAYDEFLISYKNRSAAINASLQKKAVSDNGIFRPIIVIDGQVTGLWKRSQKKDNIIIGTEFFRPHTKTELQLIKKASGLYGTFEEKNIEFIEKVN